MERSFSDIGFSLYRSALIRFHRFKKERKKKKEKKHEFSSDLREKKGDRKKKMSQKP